MAKEKLVPIFIPLDPQNPEQTVVRFQKDGVDFAVLKDEVVNVPQWVKDCAIQSGLIKK